MFKVHVDTPTPVWEGERSTVEYRDPGKFWDDVTL
jgi:hypothetical protein